MKRPTMLVEAVLRQAATDLDLSVERDVELVRRRCKHEGLSFLTITLPSLSDALERGIEEGTFSCPTSFSRHGSLPRFLGGFFKRVFALDGKLLLNPCPNVVFYIRQICRFFKKLFIGCSPSRNLKAIQHFKDVEGDLRRMTPEVNRKDSFLDKVSGIIWSQVFPEINYLDLICHHGPGATADKRLSNERYAISKWNGRSEHTFPSDLHCFPNYGLAAEVSDIMGLSGSAPGIEYLKLRDELPVRVVFVPKTQSAPRVIAIEPSHVQYMQQSVKDYVYKVVESHSLTKRSIRFTHQSVNQRLAYRSSIDKRLATLDLKDASDRVHLELVQRIFKTSGLLPYLEDARSLHATLPNGDNLVLTKYASQGSALCFPVEAMVFYTLIQSAMHQLDGRRPCSRSIRDYSRLIDIYGDDIIIPVKYTDVVVRYLESYALKVNINKSFRNSHFRESCGGDYFMGTPVNPVYARQVPHDDLRRWGPIEIMSWNATADLFYLRGMWHVSQVIRDLLARVVRRTIPRTREHGSGLAHFSFIYNTDCYWNSDLHCWKQKRLHYDPIKRKDSIDGNEHACLNKWGINVSINPQKPYPSSGYPVGRGELSSHTTDNQGHGNGQCGVRSSTSFVDARFLDSRVAVLQSFSKNAESSDFVISEMARHRNADSVEPTPMEGDPWLDHCLDQEVLPDPLSYLIGRSSGLDFLHSTKRGSFKSKCRWVSLAG